MDNGLQIYGSIFNHLIFQKRDYKIILHSHNNLMVIY